jgi:hypothetical protein
MILERNLNHQPRHYEASAITTTPSLSKKFLHFSKLLYCCGSMSCFSCVKFFLSRYFVDTDPWHHVPIPCHTDLHDKRCGLEPPIFASSNQSHSHHTNRNYYGATFARVHKPPAVNLQGRGASRLVSCVTFARQRIFTHGLRR